MRKLTITAGQVFNRWTVTREIGRRRGHRLFECKCACGVIGSVTLESLTSSRSGSCGCLQGELKRRHGMHKTAEYRAWAKARSRCSNSKDPNWKNYGGRGIRFSSEWDDFVVFIADVGPRPSPKHSLDRFPDNDGHYRPGNVRWATVSEQAKNTRRYFIANDIVNLPQWGLQ